MHITAAAKNGREPKFHDTENLQTLAFCISVCAITGYSNESESELRIGPHLSIYIVSNMTDLLVIPYECDTPTQLQGKLAVFPKPKREAKVIKKLHASVCRLNEALRRSGRGCC